MKKTTYMQAILDAQNEEMNKGEDVFIIGTGGKRSVYTTGEEMENGYNAPLSESGFMGMCFGAAMAGSRPIVDIAHASFYFVAMDPVCNSIAKGRFTFGSQATVPILMRSVMIYDNGNAAQHSERPYNMFMNVPGLKIIAPTNAYDAKGLIKAAIRDDNPVMCFECASLWMSSMEIPEEDYIVPLGVADVKREGTDVTIIGICDGITHAMKAAEELEKEGVSAEVIDPRTLVPMDYDTIYKSVKKTGRLVVVDPGNRVCGAASEICARALENCFEELKAAPVRVTTDFVPIPFSRALERQLYPSKDKVLAAVKKTLQ